MPLTTDNRTTKPVLAWLKLNKLTVFIVGILIYVLLTLAVLLWYQDDVDQMTWVDREVFNYKIISQYQLAAEISQHDVLQRLGSPDITAAVKADDDIYQVLYYRTHRSVADGITTTDECTALLFKNRHLIATGDDATRQYQAIAVNGR